LENSSLFCGLCSLFCSLFCGLFSKTTNLFLAAEQASTLWKIKERGDVGKVGQHTRMSFGTPCARATRQTMPTPLVGLRGAPLPPVARMTGVCATHSHSTHSLRAPHNMLHNHFVDFFMQWLHHARLFTPCLPGPVTEGIRLLQQSGSTACGVKTTCAQISDHA